MNFHVSIVRNQIAAVTELFALENPQLTRLPSMSAYKTREKKQRTSSYEIDSEEINHEFFENPFFDSL